MIRLNNNNNSNNNKNGRKIENPKKRKIADRQKTAADRALVRAHFRVDQVATCAGPPAIAEAPPVAADAVAAARAVWEAGARRAAVRLRVVGIADTGLRFLTA